MKANKKRRPGWLGWLLGALAVALGAALIFALLLGRRSSGSAWSEAYRRVSVTAVDYQETVEISGNMEPLAARDLSFAASGRVVEVPVRQGQALLRGALVARLDDRVAGYELAAVEASLEQKRLAGSAREIRLLELEREIKAQAVQDRGLRAPIAGLLSVLEIREGDFVAAGRTAARIVDVSSLKAKVQIDELDAPKVRIGQPVRFSFDALPQLTISGRVSQLAIEGRITPEGLTVIEGVVVIQRPPAELVVGYSFTGEIVVGEAETVLLLPRESLHKQAGETYVFLLPRDSAEPQRRKVEARLLDPERIQILSGLEDGDVVLVPLVSRYAGGSNSKLSAKGLLRSLQERARIPFLGGGSLPSAEDEQFLGGEY